MNTTLDFTIEVIVTNRANMEHQLDEAVRAAMTMATQERRQGILVTRHDHELFTVALSDSVPYGLTLEQQNR